MIDDDRRTFLTLAATATATGTTGCLTSLAGGDETNDDPTSSNGTTGGTTTTRGGNDSGADDVAYDAWMPATDGDGELRYVDVDATVAAGLTANSQSVVESAVFPFDDVLAYEETTATAGISDHGYVYAYSIPRSELATRLEDASDGTASDAPTGFDAYATADGAFWLSSDVLFYAPEPEALASIHDAKTGGTERFLADAAFDPLAPILGDADVFATSTNEVYGGVADAHAVTWAFGDGEVTVTLAVVLGDDASAADFRFPGIDGNRAFEPYEMTEKSTDGRVAMRQGTASIDAFDLLTVDSTETAPMLSVNASFGAGTDGTWDDGTEEAVTLQHGGGDSVDTSRLTVLYDDVPVSERDDVTVELPTVKWAAGAELTIRERGDSSAFSSGDVVALEWTGDFTATIFRTELP